MKRLYLPLVISLVLVLSLLTLTGCPFDQANTLTTNVSPSGAGSISPSGGDYDDGVAVTLTATPASGYVFDYWSSSASGTNPTTTVIMDADKTVTANFTQVAQTYNLSVNISPGNGGSVSPSGGTYEEGTSVTLTATPASGYTFDYWSGSASGTGSSTTVVMDSDKTVTANFVAAGPSTLFSDDFSTDTGEWDVFSASEGDVFYEGGSLHVLNYTSSPHDTTTISNQYFSDFALEVDTTLVDGTDDNWQGVICRFDSSYDNYGLFISADGYYRIVRFDGGSPTVIGGVDYSSHINQGRGAVNTIRVECVGNSLSLYVNGHLLESVTDSNFSSGYVGLSVSSLDGSYSEVAFDNLVITEPS